MQWVPDSPAAPVAVAAAAMVLLVLARRGRRINEHPICRRCGFDLVGRPADSPNCSECGADLRRCRSIRRGARRPIRGAATVAVLLLLPSLALLAFEGWSAVSEVSFAHRKPVWWLLNDADSRDAVARDEAFSELFARFRRGRLSDAQIRQVVDRALAIQGDARRAWFPQWGDFVHQAYRAGEIPEDSWRRYVGQAPQFELAATEQFKRDGRAWLELVEKPSRVGTGQDFIVRVHRRLQITDARGSEVRRDFGAVTYQVGGASLLKGGWSLPLNDGAIGRLADGRQEARLEIVVEVLDPRGGVTRATTRPAAATIRRELRTAWLVEPKPAHESGLAVKGR